MKDFYGNNRTGRKRSMAVQTDGGLRPETNERIRKIRKMTKRTLAIQAANPATTQNPRIPAMIAITKNKRVHDNICASSVYPVRNNAPLGFESQRLDFLTGFSSKNWETFHLTFSIP
jgi:hypothetical protein